MKSKALALAREIFALVDSSKIGVEDLIPFVSVEQITHLYTDSGLSPEWADRLKNVGIPFTIFSL